MSTGMNFTCISAFDISKDIIWSFSYKIENNPGGFTTFLNFLSSQNTGGIKYGLGYGPFLSGTDIYNGAAANFLAMGFDTTGYFGISGKGFSTGLSTPIFNSLTYRKGAQFNLISSHGLNFYVNSPEWQTLRFQLTNKGNTINTFYRDENFNYKLISSMETLTAFLEPRKIYIGMSFATPIQGSDGFKLKIRNFHCYGNPLP
jgi:hypothetical protein